VSGGSVNGYGNVRFAVYKDDPLSTTNASPQIISSKLFFNKIK